MAKEERNKYSFDIIVVEYLGRKMIKIETIGAIIFCIGVLFFFLTVAYSLLEALLQNIPTAVFLTLVIIGLVLILIGLIKRAKEESKKKK